MALTDAARLRGMLGDTDETNYVIKDEVIEDFLTRTEGDLDRAAYEGWRYLAGYYAGLVNVTEGNASRAMSDLLDHANTMIAQYGRSRGGPTEGRTRIGRIIRSK
jgi:hypothetical protein